MATYKCINCGEIRESDSTCNCLSCGYKTFAYPYNRSEILTGEIKTFINELEITEVNQSDFVFIGKNKDDNRFPSYEKIFKYVNNQEKVEGFISNLQETIDQLKIYYTSPFTKTYPVSYEKIESSLDEYDGILLSAVQIITKNDALALSPVAWNKAVLVYSENVNKYLWYSADNLLELIEKLEKKIITFVRANNLYGLIRRYEYKGRLPKDFEEADYKELLENCIIQTEEVINKKFVVDILDDGFDELKEMLNCLWHDIKTIMSCPLVIKNYDYIVDSKSMSETEALSYFTEKLRNRYLPFNQTADIDCVLKQKSEDELFDIYNALISIDIFGIIVPTGTKLIRVGEAEKKLSQLIGLNEIKNSISKIKAYAISNKDSNDLNIHMCFMGNPGSGKTEVARYIAEILYENKILPTNNIVEVDRSGLVSQYFGATAEKTNRVINRAMGGVLFIDEAYALGNNSDSDVTDYGKEAIDTLVKAMEDYRGKFCVILAGYKNEMQKMISLNPGFKSRIQFTLDFPNYSRDELRQITELMLNSRNYSISENALDRILDITDIKRKDPNFANAREIRNILDQVIMNQNLRCIGTDEKTLGLVDVNKYIQDSKIIMPTSSDSNKKVLTGEEELDQLIGLDSVKHMIRKIKAYAKKNKDDKEFNIHMCFYGNPGTGKTEVARILSRILYDAGVLEEAKLVETNSHGLIGKYVGETAPKTEAKIKEAMNGVLFIDEAYGLSSSDTKENGAFNYGSEAIETLIKEMEDHRGRFCVILAGYKKQMKEMLDTNPGFESRIQFSLEFPDYSREELGEIAKLIISRRKYYIDEQSLAKLLDITDYYRALPNFANARTVRNIIDKVIMNQNLRTEELEDSSICIQDIEEYILDEKIEMNNKSKEIRTIGF